MIRFLASIFILVAFATAPALARQDLIKKDLVVGTGAEAAPEARVRVHYTGWLLDGTKFDSSVDRGEPFIFTIGAREVIRGWDLGVTGMRVGGKRKLVVPPHLGYGARGAGKAIPPNATLIFEIELLGFAGPAFLDVGNAVLKRLLAEGTKIVDIRTAGEWKETGVIEGSKLLTAFDEQGRFNKAFPDALAAFAKQDEDIILICRTGRRTGIIAKALAEQAGYTGIINVKDGIKRWIDEGNPVVK